jgi:hypothetical protein
MLKQSKKQLGRGIARSMMSLGLCAAPLMAFKLDTTAKAPLVVSRIELPTGGRVELSLHSVEGKRYLYVHRPEEGVFNSSRCQQRTFATRC